MAEVIQANRIFVPVALTCVWLIISCHTSEASNVCPGGFELFETSCYRAFSETPMNGLDVRDVCAQLSSSSHLVFIESQSEQTFLKALVEAQGVETDFWIGLTTTSDGVHEWLDGTPLGDFSAWDPTGAHRMLPCIRLRRNAENLWNDRPCSIEMGYICEMEMTAQTTSLAAEVITETTAKDEDQTMQPTTVVQHLVDEQTTTPLRTVTAEENLVLTEVITETQAKDEIQTMQPTTVVQHLVDEQTAMPFRTVTAEENMVLTEVITETPAKDEDQTMQPTTVVQHLVDEQTTTPFRTATLEENLTTEVLVTEVITEIRTEDDVIKTIQPLTDPKLLEDEPRTTSFDATVTGGTPSTEALITEDITDTPEEGGDFQTVQLSTVLDHLKDDVIATPSSVTEGRVSTEEDPFTTSLGVGTSASAPSQSCKRREQNFYLHIVGKTFSDHVVFNMIKGSVLKCAAACISEACAWFVVTLSNDCLLSKEALVMDQLRSDDSASLYHVG